MKALIIRQPWAWAILNAGKNIENRSWLTHLRGTVAIHAAVGMNRDDYEYALGFIRKIRPSIQIPAIEELERGAILGAVELIDCVEKSDSPWFEGDYGFVLVRPQRLLKPIAIKGALGFWNVREKAETQIRRQLGQRSRE